MKAWKITILPLPLMLLMSITARAEPTNSRNATCDATDPRVGRVVTVFDGTAIAVARRLNQIQVGPLASLCSNDLILASKASATIEVERQREAEKQDIKNELYYYYDGAQFVPGQPDADPGSPGGKIANNSIGREHWTILRVVAEDYIKRVELLAAMKQELANTGFHVVVQEPHPLFLGSLVGSGGFAASSSHHKYSKPPADAVFVDATLTGGETAPASTAAVNGSALVFACNPAPTPIALALHATIMSGATFATLAENRADQTSPAQCGYSEPSSHHSSLLALAKLAVADLAPAIAPAQIAAVMENGSMLLNNEAAKLEAGQHLLVEITLPGLDVATFRPKRALGIIRIDNVGEKQSIAVPISTFLVPPPVGATLSPISSPTADALLNSVP